MVREKKQSDRKTGSGFSDRGKSYGKRADEKTADVKGAPKSKFAKPKPAKFDRAPIEGRRPPIEGRRPGMEDRRPVIEDNRQSGEDILRLEGRNPVMEALKSGRTIEKLFIAKGAQEGSIKQIIAMARDKGIIINEVDRIKLDTMSETRSHQGIIAVVSPYTYVGIEEILDYARGKNEPPFIVILDEIYDPHNLGSILRTADASGAHGVIISKRRAVGLTPTVAKASAGAVEYVKVAKVTNITQVIKELKDKGLWIVGADMDGEKAYYEADLTGPMAIVIGSEGEGIGRLIKENCDFVVNLPMKGKISSLNAGVAGAILMYEIVRQRLLKL